MRISIIIYIVVMIFIMTFPIYKVIDTAHHSFDLALENTKATNEDLNVILKQTKEIRKELEEYVSDSQKVNDDLDYLLCISDEKKNDKHICVRK